MIKYLLGALLILAVAAGTYVLSRIGPPDVKLSYLHAVSENGAGFNPHFQPIRIQLDVRNNSLGSIDLEDFQFVLYAGDTEAARGSTDERIKIGPFSSASISVDANVQLASIGKALDLSQRSRGNPLGNSLENVGKIIQALRSPTAAGFRTEARFKLNGNSVVHMSPSER